MSLQIVFFESYHASQFRDLNLEWLNRYFSVEPKDRELLDNPKEAILDKGGFIFMAEWKQAVAGCYAFLPFEKDIFELGKMAVDANYQGLQIGQRLLEHAIAFARNNGWKKIVLYSNSKLDTALYIYGKFGFREVPLEDNLPYARSDIKMELNLD
ncbi:MAG: GNAT family N-acetyltransferase [Bacteroidota bacterium]